MNHDEMIAVIQAHKDGKAVQYQTKSTLSREWFAWGTLEDFDFSQFTYRIKPTPQKRFIRPDELPLTCWVRTKVDHSGVLWLVTGITKHQIFFNGCPNTWTTAAQDCEWSADRKTWHSFEVEE